MYALGTNSFVQFIVSLLILALVVVLCYFTTRFIANYQKGMIGKGNIEILEAKNIGSNRYIEIVRIGEEYYALAVAKDNISLISKVDKESLHYEEPATKVKVGESFAQMMEKIKNKNTGKK